MEDAATVSGEKDGRARYADDDDAETELRFDIDDKDLLGARAEDTLGLETATPPCPSSSIVMSSGSGLPGGSQLPLNKTYMR